MGRHNYSDICFNILKIRELEPFKLYNDGTGDESDEGIAVGHDWIWSGCIDAGKNKRLTANEFTKNINNKVYTICIVNTSEYESVGVVDNVVFSDDLDAVKLFRSDFIQDITNPIIKDIDSVMQTI